MLLASRFGLGNLFVSIACFNGNYLVLSFISDCYNIYKDFSSNTISIIWSFFSLRVILKNFTLIMKRIFKIF